MILVVLTGLSSKQIDVLVNLSRSVPFATPVKPTPPAKPARQRRLSPAEAVAIAQDYRAGDSVNVLAKRYGVRRQTVSAQLERLGIARRFKILDAPTIRQAAHLYVEGWSLAKLAERYGVAPHTVRTALKRHGVQMRRPWDHLSE
jgi:lambda repressor-like predicted transcriptional regulator